MHIIISLTRISQNFKHNNKITTPLVIKTQIINKTTNHFINALHL